MSADAFVKIKTLITLIFTDYHYTNLALIRAIRVKIKNSLSPNP